MRKLSISAICSSFPTDTGALPLDHDESGGSHLRHSPIALPERCWCVSFAFSLFVGSSLHQRRLYLDDSVLCITRDSHWLRCCGRMSDGWLDWPPRTSCRINIRHRLALRLANARISTGERVSEWTPLQERELALRVSAVLSASKIRYHVYIYIYKRVVEDFC